MSAQPIMDIQSIPMDRANVCLDCSCVTSALYACPSCTSTSLWRLERWLARTDQIHCTGCGEDKDSCQCWCACGEAIAPGDSCPVCVCECGRHKLPSDFAYLRDNLRPSHDPCERCCEGVENLFEMGEMEERHHEWDLEMATQARMCRVS